MPAIIHNYQVCTRTVYNDPMKGKQPKMITARQFATVHGVPYTTVIFG
jgi:hypothetical protein